MAEIGILGAGMVGSAIAKTMSLNHDIVLLDIDATRLKSIKHKAITTQVCDLSNAKALAKAISTVDLVIGAVPGHLGYQVLENIILSGKNMIDISFFPEDASALNTLAKKHKVVVIHDCGVAPGMDNIMLGYHDTRMKVNSFKCMVGGLPTKKNPPFNYKAPFSPIDVLEEYTRPARLKVNNKIITRPALTEIESLQVDGIGTLEAFNSDGLRSLLKSMKHIPNMVEKTIRYPGHAAQMEWVREAGLLSKAWTEVKGSTLRPLDVTSKLLFRHWTYHPGEEDFTYMTVVIEGLEKKTKVRYEYILLDRYHKKSGMSSMARTTGLTACAAAELVLSESFKKPGVHPPEHLGKDDYWVYKIFSYLKERGVQYDLKRTVLKK